MKRLVLVGLGAALLLGLLLGSADIPGHRRDADAAVRRGIHKIRHVVIIMQENRSFDSYFGTYPGADGIPMKNGVPTVCNPDPKTHICVKPYHDTSDRNAGGPHDTVDAIRDINRGKMDGFQAQARKGRFLACHNTDNPGCSLTPKDPDVMGYHDWHEIPNYWDYARNFVLQDHMFEAGQLVEPAGASLPRVRLVGSVLEARQPDELQVGARGSVRRQRARPAGRLSLDGSDLAPAPLPRELALLRRERQPARLLGQQDVLPARAAERADARHLEPVAAFRHVQQDNQVGNIQPLADFYQRRR